MITLEQVDQVRERTGVSYEQAKSALEENNGDVVEAIVWIESAENSKEKFSKKASSLGEEATKVIKDLVKSGQVNRIVVEKDEKTIMNIPVAIGALGAIFLTSATVIGLIAALATGCVVKIHKENGDIINVNEEASKAMKKVTGHHSKESSEKNEEEDDVDVKVEVTETDDEIVVEVKEK